jgi:hypothetical protein
MQIWIARLNRAWALVSAWFAGIFARFTQPPRTLQQLLRIGAHLDGIVRAQLDASAGQETLYRVNGGYNCVLARSGHLKEAGSVLERLDSVLAEARTKLTEIEAALSLPVKRGGKPDKLDLQNLRAVQRHLEEMEATAQQMRQALDKEVRKQLVAALV